MTLLDVAQLQKIYDEAEIKRQALAERLKIAQKNINNTSGRSLTLAMMKETQNLESEIAVTEKYQIELQARMSEISEKAAEVSGLFGELNRALDLLQIEEQNILKEIDSEFVGLEKLGRELMQVRKSVISQIEGSGLLWDEYLPSGAADLFSRKETLGKAAWDVRRFCAMWENIRKRRPVDVPPADW